MTEAAWRRKIVLCEEILQVLKVNKFKVSHETWQNDLNVVLDPGSSDIQSSTRLKFLTQKHTFICRSWHSKMWSAFLWVVNITENFNSDRSDFNFVKLNQNCQNLNEILHFSGNIESTKKADHILEMAGQGKFCDYYL